MVNTWNLMYTVLDTCKLNFFNPIEKEIADYYKHQTCHNKQTIHSCSQYSCWPYNYSKHYETLSILYTLLTTQDRSLAIMTLL